MPPRNLKDDNKRGAGGFVGRTVQFAGAAQNRPVADPEHDGAAGGEDQPDGRHERKNTGVARRYGLCLCTCLFILLNLLLFQFIIYINLIYLT